MTPPALPKLYTPAEVREAFGLATELHRSGGDESGIDEWIAALEQQVALLESRPVAATI